VRRRRQASATTFLDEGRRTVAGDEDDGALQHGEATRRVRRLESEEGRPWVKLTKEWQSTAALG
jgi:hypothetical protein